MFKESLPFKNRQDLIKKAPNLAFLNELDDKRFSEEEKQLPKPLISSEERQRFIKDAEKLAQEEYQRTSGEIADDKAA